jgi:glyoxylase-like metal-dependent hydrolase (beta-lactamase superfamily II)
MRRSIYQPDAARDETIELPVSCGLVRHPQGNVLFDTGCNPQAAVDPEGRWGGLARVMTPIFEPHETIVPQLATVGLSSDDIDIVVCSHLHPDHCGCNDSFRRATIMCHEVELEAARAPGASKQGYLPAEWDQPNGYTTFSREHDLLGDERITLVPLPGHTPGTTGMLVRLQKDGLFLLAADAAPMRSALQGIMPKNNLDQEAAAASAARIREFEAAGATVIFGHDGEQWATLRKGQDAYE